MDTTKILQQLLELNDARLQDQKAAREKMLIAAHALVASLQTTSELVLHETLAEPARLMCLRTAIDLKIFESLDKAGSKGATVAELAQPTEADTAIVSRIMKHLAATHVVLERSSGTYAHSALSSPLSEPKHTGGIIYLTDTVVTSFVAMPTYFAQHNSAYFTSRNFRNPPETLDSPFQFAHNTSLDLYAWMAKYPYYYKVFNNYMAGYGDGRHPWYATDFYPVQQRLVDGFDTSSNAPFLVDVGGGKGHDMIALAAEHPDLPGDLVVQDIPAVVAAINPPLPEGIKSLAHDFFTPQPQSCTGARAYFLQSVFHNWPDDDCVRILEALKPALVPGYSRILVHDLLMPDTGAVWTVTAFDWAMAGLLGLGVRERTEAQFRRLFELAGLEVLKVRVYSPGTAALIEAGLPV